jgi:hypothetical protein
MRYFLIIACCFSLAVSCKKKNKGNNPEPAVVTPQLKLAVQPVFGSDTLYLDSTYTTDNGWDLQFSDIKFYFTQVGNGQNQLVDASRFDYREKGTTCFQVNGNVADFGSLSGLIGVASDLNHNDPAGFPNNSVLNIMNTNGMHWAWNTGFIFIVIEGRADTIPDGNPLFDHFFTYHVGTDDYLGNINFPAVNWGASGSALHTTTLKLDMHYLIDHPVTPIDIRSEYFSHSAGDQAALTQKVKTNFLDALTTP